MKGMMHFRGDIAGMLVFFIFGFVGLMQVLVAWKRWNGLSLTGYPDRRAWGCALGLAICAGACAWYFTGKNHFARPDMEGVETFVVMAAGLAVAIVFQFLAASLLFRKKARGRGTRVVIPEHAGRLELDVEGSAVCASYWPAAGGGCACSVLLLHDYGDDESGVFDLAQRLSTGGHPVLTLDLDGHGENPRPLSSPLMVELLTSAVRALAKEAGKEDVAAVGVGLGGTLAMALASGGHVVRAVALDPPARDTDGAPRVNALRELRPPELLRALRRARARGAEGPVDLSRILFDMPRANSLPRDKVVVMGTRDTWFNSPDDLAAFAAACGLDEPLPLDGNHASLAGGEGAARAALEALR